MIPRKISLLRLDLTNISFFKLIPLCLCKKIALEIRIRFANIRTNVNDNIRMYKKWKIKMYKNEYFYIP